MTDFQSVPLMIPLGEPWTLKMYLFLEVEPPMAVPRADNSVDMVLKIVLALRVQKYNIA